MTQRRKLLTKFILIIILALAVGLISYPKVAIKVPPVYNALNKLKINLGLDLQGGIHLEYKADLSQVESGKVDEAMQAVQDAAERKSNAFGVAEPVIYTIKNGGERKLVVELAGVKDINEAKKIIGDLPFLEFKEEKNEEEMKEANKLFEDIKKQVKQEDQNSLTIDMVPDLKYKSTGLTGKNLKNALADSQGQVVLEPVVSLQFDSEGTKLFAEITKRNVGKPVAIYLDNKIISEPRVNEEITTGNAVISGGFTAEETKDLARRLREGSLPVPINLDYQQSVDASLGQVSLEKSLKAGLIGLALVIIFMIVYYRFLGVVASLSLLIYAGLMISIFKLSGLDMMPKAFHITLTLPGIAGFVLSIGMAVDANILIFERTKEEVRRGRNILNAIEEGFKRAWTSIRDGNVSSIITAVILINLGTGFVKGFAVTLVIGVLVSMFTAVVITRTLLRFVLGEWIADRLWLVGVKSSSVDKNENKR